MVVGGLRRAPGYTRGWRQKELQRRSERQCQRSLPAHERGRIWWEGRFPVQELNTAVAKHQAKSGQLRSKFEPAVPVGIDDNDEEHLADALGEVATS